MNVEPDFKLDQTEGRALLRLSRQTIGHRLGLAAPVKDLDATTAAILAGPRLREHCGVFVTLKLAGGLRGCIGSLVGTESIVDGVRANSLKAAFGDPRFSPLSPEDFAQVRIEVSVLTPMQPLSYRDDADLLAKLRPGRDGVLLEKGGLGATFLPQVWEQLPEPERFLEHLCLKAGLAATAWRQGDLAVKVYQVQAFAE